MSTVTPFLDRLATAIPGWPDELPPEWDAFRLAAEQRVSQGDRLYGNAYRRKDNVTEGIEEACDLVAYAAFDVLIHGDEDIDLALTAAWHAYRASVALWTMRMKQRGDTGPAWSVEELETTEPTPEPQTPAHPIA